MPCRRRQGSDDEKGHEKRGRNNKLMNLKKKHQKIHMAADEKILRKAQKERLVEDGLLGKAHDQLRPKPPPCTCTQGGHSL